MSRVSAASPFCGLSRELRLPQLLPSLHAVSSQVKDRVVPLWDLEVSALGLPGLIAAVRPNGRLGRSWLWSWKLAVTASARTVLSTSPRVLPVLPCCQPPAWVYLRPALPACPYHQSPDIPAGGWDTGQRKKRKKTKETKQVEGGPCAPVAPGPPHSSFLLFSPSFPLSLLIPFFPPSFFSSSPPPAFHSLPSWVCDFDDMKGLSA